MARIFKKLLLVVLPFTLLLVVGRGIFLLAEDYFLDGLADENAAVHRLTRTGLHGALQRFEPLATLVADKDDVALLLDGDEGKAVAPALNRHLKFLAERTGASDIYVIDKNGKTLATSNFDQPYSFLGKSYAFRPYFIEAIKGEPATFFALGTQSFKRGYYFSAPVFRGKDTVGVVTVKVTVSAIEESWKGSANEVLIVDRHGIAFMASRDDWRFKSIHPLSEAALEDIKASRQYPLDQVGQVKTSITKLSDKDALLFSLEEEVNSTRSVKQTFVAHRALMSDMGWTLYVLTPTGRAKALAYTVLLFAALGIAVIGLFIAFILYRRAKLLENIKLQEQVSQELEVRVLERTEDLKNTNATLEEEIEERKRAESQLRRTQRELIQAGKLAALGQMAASLSHEINQPLAAIRAYAGNAGAFIDRGNVSKARNNIQHIEAMADRMGTLIHHLKNFARKPKKSLEVVDLRVVLKGVETIMGPQLRQKNAVLKIDLPDEDLFVKGGLVRLQQVLVNLVSNALDAMAHQENPLIEVSVLSDPEGKCTVAVRDHGKGIDPSVMDQIFDPFFTTKEVNEGLGLGLSISYNVIQDCDGALTAENHPEGGAVFTIILAETKVSAQAAE